MNQHIKEFREGLDLSQVEIAKIAGLGASMWGQIERGERPLPAEKAAKLDIELGFPSEVSHPWLGELKQHAIKTYVDSLYSNLPELRKV